MSKHKAQTSDPGENHSNNSQHGGTPDKHQVAPAVRKSNTSNKFNGSGGSRKTFSPGKVKGLNS